MFEFDTTLFLWLNASAASPSWVVPLARFASIDLPQWLIAGAIGAFMVGEKGVRRVVVRVLVAMVAAWLLARLGQYLWPMPRPFVLGIGTVWLPHGGSAGFPSTHASVAFAFATALAVFSGHRFAGGAALLAALLVAWSRVALGLHFPFDVVAGAVVGFVGAWISGWVPELTPAPVRRAHE